jgi:hypothetical protein
MRLETIHHRTCIRNALTTEQWLVIKSNISHLLEYKRGKHPIPPIISTLKPSICDFDQNYYLIDIKSFTISHSYHSYTMRFNVANTRIAIFLVFAATIHATPVPLNPGPTTNSARCNTASSSPGISNIIAAANELFSKPPGTHCQTDGTSQMVHGS